MNTGGEILLVLQYWPCVGDEGQRGSSTTMHIYVGPGCSYATDPGPRPRTPGGLTKTYLYVRPGGHFW
jgi:hypothetical protein